MKKTLLVWGSFLTLIFVAIIVYSRYCDVTTYTCGNSKEDTSRSFLTTIRRVLMMVDDTDDSGGDEETDVEETGGGDEETDVEETGGGDEETDVEETGGGGETSTPSCDSN